MIGSYVCFLPPASAEALSWSHACPAYVCHGHFAKLNRSPRLINLMNQMWFLMKGI